MDWLKDQEQPAAVAVLLFALTCTPGSVVSRIAQDFFNDDDLNRRFGGMSLPRQLTEDRIRTSVYCKFKNADSLLRAEKGMTRSTCKSAL
jgi:hypothetical protein